MSYDIRHGLAFALRMIYSYRWLFMRVTVVTAGVAAALGYVASVIAQHLGVAVWASVPAVIVASGVMGWREGARAADRAMGAEQEQIRAGREPPETQ